MLQVQKLPSKTQRPYKSLCPLNAPPPPRYKKRKCTGGAIHIAALQTDGELLEQLLDPAVWEVHVCGKLLFLHKPK